MAPTARNRGVLPMVFSDGETGLGLGIDNKYDDSLISSFYDSVEIGRNDGRRLSGSLKGVGGSFRVSPEALSDDDGSSLPSLEKIPTTRSPVMQDVPLGPMAPTGFDGVNLQWHNKTNKQRGFGPAFAERQEPRKSHKKGEDHWDSLGDITGLSSIVPTADERSDGKRKKRRKEFMALKSVDIDTSDKLMFSAMNSLQKRINDLQEALNGANADIAALKQQLVAKDTAFAEMERKARKYKELARQYRDEKGGRTRDSNDEAPLSPPKSPDVLDGRRLDALEEEIRGLRQLHQKAVEPSPGEHVGSDAEGIDEILQKLKALYVGANADTNPAVADHEDSTDSDIKQTLGKLQELLRRTGAKQRDNIVENAGAVERRCIQQLQDAVNALMQLWDKKQSSQTGSNGTSDKLKLGPMADLCRQLGLASWDDDDEPGNETERPTQSNDDALGVVYDSLMADYNELLAEYREVSQQYAALDPTKDSRRRTDLLARMDNVIQSIEQRSKPLYALGDIMISLNIPVLRPEPVAEFAKAY